MISFLRGKIIHKKDNYIILDVRDVGYKIFVNYSFLEELTKDKDLEIYIHEHIREDMQDLYGFRNPEELELFQLLLSISGVGPKSAISVLAVGSVGSIKKSIACGDYSLLTQVSGIGKKTAQRVVLELKDKIGALLDDDFGNQESSSVSFLSDEFDALVALGYSLAEARSALQKVDPNIVDSGARIKQALKNI